MVRTTVYLNQETAWALRQLAAVEGRSQAELIRDALEGVVATSSRKPPLRFDPLRFSLDPTDLE
jgi:hypothetical protein